MSGRRVKWQLVEVYSFLKNNNEKLWLPFKNVMPHTTRTHRQGWAGFHFRGGRVDRALRPDLPPQKKGSIDGSPKILPRLTPGPWR